MTETYNLTQRKLTQPLPVLQSPHQIIDVSQKHLLDRPPIMPK